MPWRPAARGGERGRRERPAAQTKPRRSLFARLRRALLTFLLLVLLVPFAVILAYRVLPVPVTPLMVIRLTQGEGLDKDWRPLDEIAGPLPAAVVAAEDNLFCEHAGFDLQALKGEIDDWLAGGDVRGASTITMQTAKNLFLWPDRSLLRKALEAWLTPQIELLWPKERIIEVYLNIVEFGPGIYGAEAGARRHFGKHASELTGGEAALLAAVLPNPRQWSASDPGEYVRSRVPIIQTRVEQLGPRLDCIRRG